MDGASLRTGDGSALGGGSAVPLPPLSPSDVTMRANVRSGSPLVSLEHKFIFCDAPKVGCTKWKQFFRRLRGVPNWAGRDARGVIREAVVHREDDATLLRLKLWGLAQASALVARGSGYFVATVVRDPLERLLSTFLHICWQAGMGVPPCVAGGRGRERGGRLMATLADASSRGVEYGANHTTGAAGNHTQGHTSHGEHDGVASLDPIAGVQGTSIASHATDAWGRNGPDAAVKGRRALEGRGGVQGPSQGRTGSGGQGDSVAAFASTVQRFAALSPSQWNKHFVPQAYFCDRYKYLPRYDAIARSDDDIHDMLSHLGLWEPFAASGWGPGANESMLQFTNAHTQGVRADASSDGGPQLAAHGLLTRHYTPDVLAVALSVLQVDYDLFRLPLPGWALEVWPEVGSAACASEKSGR
eukprot:jgi/Mesvir1/6068/Mv00797-RA.2